MSLFSQTGEPIFLKESSDAQAQLDKLRELAPLLNAEGRKIINQDIRRLEYGIEGEKNIIFELKNSHMPIVILHDIYLEDGDLSAQIDFVVYTKKMIFFIECKNMYGDIEITSSGDFIRKVTFDGKTYKEGFYSPITQSQRHLELLKKIKMDNSKIVKKMLINQFFDELYFPIIVLANSKTVLNAKYAKKAIKEKVIRADQLVSYIKDTYSKSKDFEDRQNDMIKRAESLLSLHTPSQRDCTEKYKKYINLNDTGRQPKHAALPKDSLIDELKTYRLNKSKEENIAPYFLYNNSQLNDLVSKMPRTKEELKKVSGFAEVKTERYGNDLLEIINRY